MRMTIGSVMDDINEWQGPNGTVYYVTAFFTNNEMLSVGKRDMDAAMEVKGLLQEVIEVPQEFILEPKGQTKKGNPKWNLKAFGPPEGVWTYSMIKGGQPEVAAAGHTVGAAKGVGGVDAGSHAPSRPPPLNNVDASIRASVALKAAANVFVGLVEPAGMINLTEFFKVADACDEWLAKKSSGVTPQGSPEDKGVEPGTGEGLGSTPTKWQERVKDWPDPSENPL